MSYQTQNVEEFFHIKATLIVGKPYKTKLSTSNMSIQKMYLDEYLTANGMIYDMEYLNYLKICLKEMKEIKPKKEMRYIN